MTMLIAAQLASQIVGATCFEFRLLEGGTLILYLACDGFESSKCTLWMECAWRLRRGNLIQIGSLDDSDSVLEALQQVKGCTIEHVSVADATGDLSLSLSGDLLIETFGYAVVLEHWEFRRSDGLRIGVAQFQPYQRMELPRRSGQ